MNKKGRALRPAFFVCSGHEFIHDPYHTGEPLKGLAFALKRRARASARLAFAPTRARRRGRGDRRAIEKSFQS
ncbi:MAG TPA: hypothetical protein VEB64_07095, partial [Azospirillaceae bacterium]|nr:hypothetical protein [Azospirillaceae bacterium]